MNKLELEKAIYHAAQLTGSFKLRSGQVSNHYFDKFQFESDPRLLSEIAQNLKHLVPSNTEIIAGIEMGAIPIATALSLATGIPAVFVRKQAKAYGTCKLAEGADISGKQVCIIEDIVTTGGQIIQSARELARYGAILKTVLCVIERDPRGRINLENEHLELLSLFHMDHSIPQQ
ncbi:orotate phosphoribosyltransferase [Paenibacillus sp. UNC451MF]|uniref:orotate phosphoribosyltransferase n=1 Tax=Paenibacillus sp. UNC451MF TaxID=1449063 RepID=UPI00048FE022|nr:orotate phosphoribosyltransferase [Paenibacillus sp. UNC451MF]